MWSFRPSRTSGQQSRQYMSAMTTVMPRTEIGHITDFLRDTMWSVLKGAKTSTSYLHVCKKNECISKTLYDSQVKSYMLCTMFTGTSLYFTCFKWVLLWRIPVIQLFLQIRSGQFLAKSVPSTLKVMTTNPGVCIQRKTHLSFQCWRPILSTAVDLLMVVRKLFFTIWPTTTPGNATAMYHLWSGTLPSSTYLDPHYYKLGCYIYTLQIIWLYPSSWYWLYPTRAHSKLCKTSTAAVSCTS